MARKSPIARAGNYTAPIDADGMDASMQSTLGLTKTAPLDPTEASYVKSRKNAPSATQAVRNARKANKQPPIPE